MYSLRPRVRRAHAADAKSVLPLFYSVLAEHGFDPTPVNLNAEVARFGTGVDPKQDDFVAVSGGKICGFLVLLEKTPGCGELAKVFVARSHRGRGVGTLLVDACIEAARARGYRKLVLETHTAFAEARRYYERHGWTPGPDLPIAISSTRTYSLDLLRDARPRVAVRSA